jgi:hypothetical protein
MSAARTARRRRKQAAMGVKGLEQVFGKRRAPKYPGPIAQGVSAAREIAFRERQKKIAGRKSKK